MTLPDGRMVWVAVPRATYGVVVDMTTMTVVWSAPIARWMTGKPWAEVRAWIRSKGGRVLLLPATRRVRHDG